MGQRCRGSDFAFPVPEDWVERSMVGFSAPPTQGRMITPNILVSVTEIAADEALDAFVDRQLDDLGRNAAQFSLTSRRAAELDGVACVEIVFRWQGEAGAIRQRQVYARRHGSGVLSLTHTAQEQDFDGCDGMFVTMLREFAWTVND